MGAQHPGQGGEVRARGRPGRSEAPSDPRFAAQTGFAELAEAWQVEQGSRDKRGVVVAIIDSGLDVRHEDIQDNLWRNEDEGPGDLNRDGCPGVCRRDDDGDGLSDFSDPDVLELLSRGFTRAQAAADDDENGYIDDLNGYDFAAESANVTDRDGHGTHLAGVVGGVGDNGRGVSGVLWRTQIMPLKVARRQDGLAELPAIARAMRYAGQNGADVILHGYTLTLRNPTEETIANLRALFGRTGTKHIVQVAAAGDRGHDLGRKERRPGLASLISDQGLFLFPVSLGVDTVIAVAAHDEFAAQLAPSSNRGPGVVQMAGPGVNVLSTLPANRYGYRDGSAAAAAYVAGLTGLLINRYPELRNRPLEVVRFLDQRGTLLENPEILTSLHYQFTHPPVLTGTLYDETPFRFPHGFCDANTYDADLVDADTDGDLDLLEISGNPGSGANEAHLFPQQRQRRLRRRLRRLLGPTVAAIPTRWRPTTPTSTATATRTWRWRPSRPRRERPGRHPARQPGQPAGGHRRHLRRRQRRAARQPADHSRDVDFCDFDCDGAPDLFVTNVEGDRVLRNVMGSGVALPDCGAGGSPALSTGCLTSGTDCFEDRTATWLAGIPNGDGHNSRCVDVDLDGDPDVVTMNLDTTSARGPRPAPAQPDPRRGRRPARGRHGDVDSAGHARRQPRRRRALQPAGGSGCHGHRRRQRRRRLRRPRRPAGPRHRAGGSTAPPEGPLRTTAWRSTRAPPSAISTFRLSATACRAAPPTASPICRRRAPTRPLSLTSTADGDPDLLEANGDANYNLPVQNRFHRNRTAAGINAAGRRRVLRPGDQRHRHSVSATCSSRPTSSAATSTATATSTWCSPTTAPARRSTSARLTDATPSITSITPGTLAGRRAGGDPGHRLRARCRAPSGASPSRASTRERSTTGPTTASPSTCRWDATATALRAPATAWASPDADPQGRRQRRRAERHRSHSKRRRELHHRLLRRTGRRRRLPGQPGQNFELGEPARTGPDCRPDQMRRPGLLPAGPVLLFRAPSA